MGKPKLRDTTADQAEEEGRRTPDALSSEMKDSFDKVLKAIADTKNTLQTQISTVATELGLLRVDHRALSERVKLTEQSITELEPTQKAMQMEIKALTAKVHVLETRAEDAEGRSRRCNIRVVGLPEKIEGTNVQKYLEDWLRTQMPEGTLSQFFALERAHRVPARPPAPGRPPRPVIAKVFFFRDRDAILQRARMDGPVAIDNSKVSIFPDYTAGVQARRSSFMEVKREMRQEGIKYALMFPAKLRVTLDDSTHIFFTPAEAWDWWETYKAGGGDEVIDRSRRAEGHSKRKRSGSRRRGTKGPTQEQVKKDQQRAIKMAADHVNVDVSTPDLERILHGGRDGGSDSSDTAPELVPDTLVSFSQETL